MALRRFQFLQEIASGGFGSVYLAKLIPPSGEPRVVAVKMLHRRWTDNVEIASRMRDEARLLARIRHENIVEVLDFAVIDRRSAVVMEVLEAADLKVILDHCEERRQQIPLGAAMRIAASVASALDAAYNRPPEAGGRPMRVIHRDIKPSNVMVDARGRVKVLDFGVARAEFEAREAKTADLAFGSLEYMPPERLFFEPESAASDVYSLGTALYELLALEKLGKAKLRQSEQERFLAERLADLVERYPMPSTEIETEVVAVLKAMLAFDESRRPSAGDLAVRLGALADRLGKTALQDWARALIPPLVEQTRSRFQGGGTLIGTTLTEDPPASGPPRAAPTLSPEEIDEEDAALLELDDEDDDGPGTEQYTNVVATRRRGVEDDETATHTDLIGRNELVEGVLAEDQDDTHWSTLKQQTLDKLGETGQFSPPPLIGARRNRPEPHDPDPWPDELESGVFESADLGGETHTEIVSQSPRAPLPASDTETVVMQLAEAETVVASLAEVERASAPPPPRPPPQRAPTPPPVARQQAPSASSPHTAYLLGAAMLLLAATLVFFSGMTIGGFGIAALALPSRRAAPEPRPAAAAPAPAEVAPPIQVAPSDTPGTRGALFRSRMPGTRRMMVRCDGVTASGADQVLVPGDSFAECTVTAIDGSRKRQVAVVDGVTARIYTCFGSASDAGCQ